MTAPPALKPEDLCKRCEIKHLGFASTQELEDLTGVVGQARALEAVRFGIGIRQPGYNLYVLGPPGHGKPMVSQCLEQKAASDPTPSDWCYVNNFEQPHKPKAIRLPPGRGRRLRLDMEELVAELQTAIPTVFQSEEYRTRRQEFDDQFNRKKAEALEQIKQEAAKKHIALIRTPVGFAFSPVRDEKVLSPEEFQKLPDKQQQQIAKLLATLEQKLEKTLHQISKWRKQRRKKLDDFNTEITTFAVGHLMDRLNKAYADFPEVLAYLEAVRQEVVKHVDQFRGEKEASAVPVLGMPDKGKAAFGCYQVNLLVDHEKPEGAPVVYEEHPTHQNLIGRVEHESQLGMLVTDFSLIKPGALHSANGGYLVLDAQKLLMQPFAWESLKRSLVSCEIRMESVGNMLGLVSTVSLEPEPIPLDVKVILLGEPSLYYLLYQFDNEFNELFKVAADFESHIGRSPENGLMYARLIATLARKEGLCHLDRGAVGRLIEHSARLAGDAQKLSAHMGVVTDLLRESDYWARQNGQTTVRADDVQQAIDAQIRRADRLRDVLDEQIRRGILLIETRDKKIGQVNGLSVIELGNFAFSRPARITATTRMGGGDVIDIEREVKLGGAIHSKGVLILSQFLAARYSRNRPFSLEASLVFEQSYGMIEGDSASLAELCALLSALSEAPIKQSLAVTGSVNQRGQVQAVGAVNEKIEGFYDACQVQGLAADQGVLIPASNVQHLMLRKDVVQAAAAGQFHIYPIRTVDEAIELLTGITAGQRDSEGQFPEGSINHSIEARLIELSTIRQQFGKGESEDTVEVSADD